MLAVTAVETAHLEPPNRGKLGRPPGAWARARGRLPSGASAAIGVSIAVHVAVWVAAVHPRVQPAGRGVTSIEVTLDDVPDPIEQQPSSEPSSAARSATPVRPAVHPASASPKPALASRVGPAAPPSCEAPRLAPAAPVVVGDDALPHFAFATSAAVADSPASWTTGSAVTPAAGDVEGATYAEASVDVPARATGALRPTYPFEAQASGIEASVQLEITVSRDGQVESARAMNHPGHGFEEAAIAAARATRFAPAMKRGRPVRVRMAWAMRFELQ
jgi:protein TonB